jgi:hypothetical protein
VARAAIKRTELRQRGIEDRHELVTRDDIIIAPSVQKRGDVVRGTSQTEPRAPDPAPSGGSSQAAMSNDAAVSRVTQMRRGHEAVLPKDAMAS